MDEFGVLVESMGFRANGRSAPMTKSKSNHPSRTAAQTSANDSYSFSVDELDGIFRSNHIIDKPQQSGNFPGEDDLFGASSASTNQYGEVDLESVLRGSNSMNSTINLNSKNSEHSDAYDDLLGLSSTRGDHADDSFGSLKKVSVGKEEKSATEIEDLLGGLGGTGPSNNRVYSGDDFGATSNVKTFESRTSVIDDSFSVFQSSGSQSDSFWPFDVSLDKDVEKGSVKSSFDDFSEFRMAEGTSGHKTSGMSTSTTADISSSGTISNEFPNVNYIDEIFGAGNVVRPNKSAKPSSTSQVHMDDLFHEEKRPESKSQMSVKITTPARREVNDFNLLFGDISTSSGEFTEIEGEPKERRRARLNRHIRMNERMAEALAEKNQRDLQSWREQEEKCRLAQTLEYDIKRWAAGKEGNLRALLSSLQEVLWPECSWRPVSLTDMITSESVKKVYKKATLYVHPDKVQQKGANLQQKYIAEKVFDILKEAWNKFSADELR